MLRNRELRVAAVFISPAILFFLVFWAAPVLLALYYSFTDWQVGQDETWTGVANYAKLLSDPQFHTAVLASMSIVLIVMAVSLVLALGVAIVLADPRIQAGRLWRVSVIVPVVTDWVATGLVFQLFFLPNQGVLASFGQSLGIDALNSVRWTTDAGLAPWAIAIFVIWKQTGLYAIFFLAGLKGIPGDILEASKVDGANSWQTFWRIRWPMMTPVTVFVVVLAFVTTLGLFEPVYLLTGGGPAGATRTLPLFLFENFFTFGNSGYASAAGIYFLLLSLMFTYAASRILKDRDES
ncbi:carbohydrate ABC transporter membrane protein 1, CUT1 family [Actinokineospora alba]|uniref:Carbohydrate ABC transporter membrane protein 1, CUT1 family n=1 Tax=Actinokineospora alba TaxID=504798 RepID=A0A1H0R531_9PSEU|nr:sugar ABC transporter permease [Actinokineospora alba]TDP70265.1 carbohydrate ABC transporter membrane protein 1 (CUT1 family) [Actinokineospora alba]SDI35429.1 multiple sugar transport system permease protein/lactose/L-arabinose transport system permease protein [Actinokineospora alba]SDP24078.1 carbohydrate ABC transporter membrane protein 1, CUT1 family [Actinokineospora alba]